MDINFYCTCIQKVEKKYTELRNKAIEEDQKKDKHPFYVPNLIDAKNKYSAEYYLDLIALKHDNECTGMNEIERLINKDRKRLNSTKESMNNIDFEEEKEKLIKKWKQQKEECDEHLKEFTYDLNEFTKTDLACYWSYVSSIKHLNLYRETQITTIIPTTNAKKFNHRLDENHFQIITQIINEYGIFLDTVTLEEVKQIFNLSFKNPVGVNNNRLLAHLFNQLSINNLIDREWQSIIEKNQIFIGKRGKIIVAKNLSSSLSSINISEVIYKQISNTIEMMLKKQEK